MVILAIAGYAIYAVIDLGSGIHRSQFTLPGGIEVPQNSGETNILVMGLDSRLNEDGKPLPAAMYAALHAGSGSDGGYNANVLMLIHIPAGGGKATGISIPRDDYVSYVGSPDGVSAGKIKEAYGLALDQKLRELTAAGGLSTADAYQQARAAGRQAEIATVSQFLGGVAINHFIEVTMAAFYETAVAVQPITVCLNENTQDSYSGANFHAGYQQLSAAQALSFVRQRRDTSGSGINFSDLDRERRQQAFIVSLAYKLKQTGTLANLGTIQSLINSAKHDIALDSAFDPLSFVGQASRIAGGNMSFSTLPIAGFGIRGGQSVNLVNLATVRAEVNRLLAPPTATPRPTGAPSSAAAKPTPTVSPTANVYHSWTTPLQAGSIPCVN